MRLLRLRLAMTEGWELADNVGTDLQVCPHADRFENLSLHGF